MKKIIVFVMLMMCVASLSAQWSVTPEAGMNVTKYKSSVPKIGYKVGAAVEYAFGTGGFSLQSGLYYLRRGTGVNTSYLLFGTEPGGTPGYGNIWLTPGASNSLIGAYLGGYGFNDGYGLGGYKMDVEGLSINAVKERKEYLQLPILARFNWKVGNDVKIHVAAGPYFALGIGGKKNGDYATWYEDGRMKQESFTDNPFKPSNGWSEAARFDWGLSLNAGIEVKRVTFDVSYDAGFGRTYKGVSDASLKYHTTSFTMGYKF